jgi:hypothetical protein
MPLEILHGAFVLFRSLARFEGAEVAALAGLRIYLPGIEPVFAGLQFADHGGASFSLFMAIIVIAARLFHLVVPGRAIWRGPGIHSPGGGYGFRARSFHSRPGMTSLIFRRSNFQM